MDLEKFRSHWSDPEFEQSFARLDQEPSSSVRDRMKAMDARERRWRRTSGIIMKGSLLAMLVLAALRVFGLERPEVTLQTVAFIIEMAVIFGLQLVDKAREKYELPKLWLNHTEFLLDEHRRLDRKIRLDQWASWLLSVAIACVALYAAPLLSAASRIVCLAAAAAAVVLLRIYDHRNIAQLKRTRDSIAV